MKPVEVLLVEDNAGDAVLTRQVLADGDTPVNLHIARDGEQALLMLESPDFQADLIILDLNIPRVSGLSVLERNERKSTPVVVFSSSWNENEIERALGAGACEYVQKPTDIQAFIDAVSGMVQRWGVRRDPHSTESV